MVTRNGEKFNQRTGRPWRAARRPKSVGCQFCHEPETRVVVAQVQDEDGVIHKVRLLVCEACGKRNFPATAPAAEVMG